MLPIRRSLFIRLKKLNSMRCGVSLAAKKSLGGFGRRWTITAVRCWPMSLDDVKIGRYCDSKPYSHRSAFAVFTPMAGVLISATEIRDSTRLANAIPKSSNASI